MLELIAIGIFIILIFALGFFLRSDAIKSEKLRVEKEKDELEQFVLERKEKLAKGLEEFKKKNAEYYENLERSSDNNLP